MNQETPITESLIKDSQEQLLTHYQEILARDPEDPAVLYQIAELYYVQGKLEASISYYRRLWQVENSQEAILCFQLGQSQEQAGQLQEAIASYLDAVRRSPETFDYCHRLGETLVTVNQPQHWEKTIALYQSIITLKPDVVWAHHFLGDALQNTQQWEAACQAYRNAISAKPDFFWSYLFLGNCAKELQHWEEVVKAYQRALELKPETTYLNNAIGEAYYQLGKKYVEQNQLEKAVQWYQKALEKQPHQQLAYYDLREKLIQGYYELSLQQAEAGQLSEGVAWFQKVSEIESQHNIYEYLWRGLNGLGSLDETNPLYHQEIDVDTAFTHFNNTSQYQVINLWDLTDESHKILNKASISIANLELIIKDQIALEKIYLKSDGYIASEGIEIYDSDKDRHFHKTLVTSGYIYAICPWQGTILKSNKSFVIDYNIGAWFPAPVQIYRFVGYDIFYLLVGDFIGNKICVYIPRKNLIVNLRVYEYFTNPIQLINKFKAYSVTNMAKFLDYIKTSEKKVAVILGFFSNIGHYTWNDLSGLHTLYETGLFSNIDRFVVGSWEYFKVGDIWPEIPPEKILKITDSSNLYLTLLKENCVSIRVTDLILKEELAKRITKGSFARCHRENPTFMSLVAEARQHYPLVCFQIRSHVRIWLSQVEGIANIINKLYQKYPNCAILFDGWSRTDVENIEDEKTIQKEEEIVTKIKMLIDPNIAIYNAIGCKTYEKVVWSDTIDTYVAPAGSGLTFLSTIINKMGVAHGDSVFFHHGIKVHLSLSRENGVPPLFVPGFPKKEDEPIAPVYRNYECDWQTIYEQVIKILEA